jgi:hypothetical protein
LSFSLSFSHASCNLVAGENAFTMSLAKRGQINFTKKRRATDLSPSQLPNKEIKIWVLKAFAFTFGDDIIPYFFCYNLSSCYLIDMFFDTTLL